MNTISLDLTIRSYNLTIHLNVLILIILIIKKKIKIELIHLNILNVQ